MTCTLPGLGNVAGSWSPSGCPDCHLLSPALGRVQEMGTLSKAQPSLCESNSQGVPSGWVPSATRQDARFQAHCNSPCSVVDTLSYFPLPHH